MNDVSQRKSSARRRGGIWQSAPFALASVVAFAVAVTVDRLAPKIVEIFQLANILGGNSASGVESELAYQIIGHVPLALLAISAWVAGSALLRRVRHQKRSRGRTVALALLRRPWLVASVFVACVFGSMLASRLGVSEDGYFVGLDDDAMISLRYAWNLAHGRGLVYNVGERVEGYTNFLWTVLASIPFVFGASQSLVGLLVLTLNFVLVGVTVYTMNGTLRRLAVPRWAIFFAAVAFVFDCNTVYFGASGLETIFLAALVSSAIFFAVSGRAVETFLSLGAIPLARSDGALLATLLAVTTVLELRRQNRPIKGAAFVFLPFVCHVAWRKLYYGEWFPNTYFLKMLDIGDRVPMGIGSYGFRICWLYAPMLFLLAASIALPKRRSLAVGFLLPVVVQGAYGVFVGGDAFWFVRFLAPTLPLLYMGTARMLGALVPVGARALPAMLAFGTLGLALTPVQTEFGRVGETVSAAGWAMTIGSTARWMRANLPPGSLLTTYPAGGVPLFAPDIRFIDVLGKNDRHIGHLARYESLMLGHNRFDFDYVYGARRPDVAFTDRDCASYEQPRYMNEAERSSVRQHDLLHSPAWDFDRTNPIFIARYAPNAVRFVGWRRRLMGCLFVREDANVAQFWGPSGPPPRARKLEWVFGAANADERIALGGRWDVRPPSGDAPGFGTSPGTAVGEGVVDAWIDVASEARAILCLRPASSKRPVDPSILVNGAPVPSSTLPGSRCAGESRVVAIGQEVLRRRTMSTRLQFPAGLELQSVVVEVVP